MPHGQPTIKLDPRRVIAEMIVQGIANDLGGFAEESESDAWVERVEALLAPLPTSNPRDANEPSVTRSAEELRERLSPADGSRCSLSPMEQDLAEDSIALQEALRSVRAQRDTVAMSMRSFLRFLDKSFLAPAAAAPAQEAQK